MTNELASLEALRDRLVAWAITDAYPLWATRGVDTAAGGFREALTVTAEPTGLPRRARVQPRQVVAFGCAGELGWHGPAADIMDHGFAYIDRVFRRPDGLLRALVAADDTVLDENAVTYDQTFALLAHAVAHRRHGGGGHHDAAAAMLASLETRLRVGPGCGFGSSEAAPTPLLSNPHMHMLEAALGWWEAGGDGRWASLADEIATLALERMIDGQSGALFEVFEADWSRGLGLPGRLIEPGHQFEWAWLLLRWGEKRSRDDAIEAAIRLIDLAEAHGIDPRRGVACEAILDDMTVYSAVGRTWPQTERIKAGLLARAVSGQSRFGDVALRGGRSLLRYLEMDVPGLYRDRMQADGSWGDDPVPASTFYHIVFAVLELVRLV